MTPRPLFFLPIFLMLLGPPAAAAQATTCGLAQPAFCDTFDQPFPPNGRTGPLDPSKWSVSRLSSIVNTGQGMLSTFQPADAMHCKTPITGVVPPNDYFMCGVEAGESEHFMEAFHDGGNYVYNSVRPLQPFDFSNRTGTVTFDVDAKTSNSHGWWIEFWLTDQPVAAPHDNTIFTGPRNGVGLAFNDPCNGVIPGGTDGSPMGSIAEAVVFHNYAASRLVPWAGADGITLSRIGCYAAMPDMKNHVEVRITPNRLEVWATDAGPTGPLKPIATVDGMNLPFSQGYVHFQHAQYNAEKATGDHNVSHSQTYHWDNIGFDGPLLPPLVQYSVPDSLTAAPGWVSGSVNVGYWVTANGVAGGPLKIPDVDLGRGVTAATLTFDAHFFGAPNLSYRLNGGAWHLWIAPSPFNVWTAGVLAVNAAELVQGVNTIDFDSVSDQVVVANIDLLLGGQAAATPGPTMQATPQATLVPTQVPTQVPTVAPTSSPTLMASATPVPAATQVPCQVSVSIFGTPSPYRPC